MMETLLAQIRIRPWHVLAAGGAYLVAAWSVFLIVDVSNLAGLRDRLIASGLEDPSLWYRLFMERGPTEILQWLALGTAGLVAAVLAGRWWHDADERRRAAARFWLIMSVALTLMLIEDSGNPRHRVRQWAEIIGGSVAFNRAAEFACFIVLAAVPLYGLLRYGRSMWGFVQTRFYLIAAFGFYALASGSSATRHWGDWYIEAGSRFHAMLGDDLVRIDHHQPTEFWLMDWLFEESVELIGATLMLTAVVAFCWEVSQPTEKREGRPDGSQVARLG